MNLDSKSLLGFALLCATPSLIWAAPLDQSNLVGKWDYTSFTMIQSGRPAGRANFAPSALVFTYRSDGTWEMDAADERHTHLEGTYHIRKSELIMRKEDGSPYQDVEVEMSNDGKQMTLRDKRSIVTATKVGTSN